MGLLSLRVAASAEARKADLLPTRSPTWGPQTNALEGAKEVSHGPYCDRSGWNGIPNLRPQPGRLHRSGEAPSNGPHRRVAQAASSGASDPRNLRRSLRHRRPGAGARPRGARRAGDAGSLVGGRSSRHKDRRARRTCDERGIVPNRPAVGARAEHARQGAQVDVRQPRGTDRYAHQAHQLGARMDAPPRHPHPHGFRAHVCCASEPSFRRCPTGCRSTSSGRSGRSRC
jgi:hypothetical protein